jgi:hypothetical protein
VGEIAVKNRLKIAAEVLLLSAPVLAQAPAPHPAPNRFLKTLGETSEANLTLFELAMPPGRAVPLRTHNTAAFGCAIEGQVECCPSPTRSKSQLTPTGRKQLKAESKVFDKRIRTIQLVMRTSS